MPAKHQSGQVVLILILTVIVGMTVALAIYFDSITDVTLTSTEDRSERAFNAAEGGIEDLISRDDTDIAQLVSAQSGEDQVQVGELTADVKVAEQHSIESLVNQNDVVTVKLEGGTANKVRVSWTHANETCGVGDGHRPGVIIERWFQESGETKIDRTGYYSVGCSPDADFAAGSTSPDSGFQSSTELSMVSTDLLLRIQPIFNQTTILAQSVGTGDLPPQSLDIVSKASFGQSNESRAIKANRSYSDLPSIFDYTLFSGDDLVKQ